MISICVAIGERDAVLVCSLLERVRFLGPANTNPTYKSSEMTVYLFEACSVQSDRHAQPSSKDVRKRGQCPTDKEDAVILVEMPSDSFGRLWVRTERTSTERGFPSLNEKGREGSEICFAGFERRGFAR